MGTRRNPGRNAVKRDPLYEYSVNNMFNSIDSDDSASGEWCTPRPLKSHHSSELDMNSLIKRYTHMTKSKKKRIRKRAKKSESAKVIRP